MSLVFDDYTQIKRGQLFSSSQTKSMPGVLHWENEVLLRFGKTAV